MIITVDPELCSGCRICEAVCSFSRRNSIKPSASNIKILNHWVAGESLPVICLNCPDPPCVDACPIGTLYVDNGIVKLNRDTCAGCGFCVEACPYHAITIREGKASKCDLCGGNPLCVRYCPTGALKYVEPEFKDGLRLDIKKYTEKYNEFIKNSQYGKILKYQTVKLT